MTDNLLLDRVPQSKCRAILDLQGPMRPLVQNAEEVVQNTGDHIIFRNNVSTRIDTSSTRCAVSIAARDTQV